MVQAIASRHAADRPKTPADRRAAMEELVELQHDGDSDRASRRVVLLRAMLGTPSKQGSAIVEATAPSVALFAEAPPESGAEQVPTWIELIPAPRDGEDHIEVRDWRPGFRVPDPQGLVDKFRAEPQERRAKVIDWDHKSHRNWGGDRNPAAAWIEDLEVRDRAVWGKVGWTPEGHDDVLHRRYRYISPVVAVMWPADSDGNIDFDGVPIATGLIDAALTNNPATYIRDLAMTPVEAAAEQAQAQGQGLLAASISQHPTTTIENENETMLLSTEALAHLGLPETATPDQINAAILAKSNGANSQPPPVPAPHSDERVSALERELALMKDSQSASQSAAREAQVASVLLSHADRFTPAERETLVALGRDPARGPEFLQEMLSQRPSMADLQREVPPGGGPQSARQALSDVEASVADKLGMDRDRMVEAKRVHQQKAGRFSPSFISSLSMRESAEV